MEVDTMSSTTSLATIQSLCKMFACVGLPEQVITDNGRNFVSEEFKEFVQKNEIKHTTSAWLPHIILHLMDWLNVLFKPSNN